MNKLLTKREKCEAVAASDVAEMSLNDKDDLLKKMITSELMDFSVKFVNDRYKDLSK